MRSIQWGEQLHEAGEGSWGHFCHGKKLLYLNWMYSVVFMGKWKWEGGVSR